MKIHPVEFEVFKNLFLSIAEEMGVTLCRTGFSPNIKERLDYSCAVYDAEGETIAQGDHMPVHLGAMPLSVRAAIDAFPMEPGDIVMLNDPFHGGTHLPDITLVSPVFLARERRPAFFVANRAHHSDVGGMSPGSMPVAREIYQEGLILPPVRLVRRGRIVDDVLALLLANVRTPDEREGDLTAQIAANRVADARLRQTVARYGRARVARLRRRAPGLHRTRAARRDSRHSRRPLRVRGRARRRRLRRHADPDSRRRHDSRRPRDDRLHRVPIRRSQGSVNANYAMTLSACLYAFRCLVQDDVLYNAGVARPLTVIAPEGTIVNARRPAAVAGGNVETSQRITDVVLGALGQGAARSDAGGEPGDDEQRHAGRHAPGDGPAVRVLRDDGRRHGRRAADWPACRGVHTHMSNTRNTPVEAIEHYLPVRIRQYASAARQRRRRRGSAAATGIVREYELLTAASVTVLSERRRGAPYGAQGGEPGAQRPQHADPRRSGTGAAGKDSSSSCAPAIVCASKRPAAADTGASGN